MTGIGFMAVGIALCAGLGMASSPASAQTYMELEAARANARAGGPVSGRDAELLERYGCLSGTNSDFCRKLSARDNPKPRVKKRRQSRK
jgi:hypothetical protein